MYVEQARACLGDLRLEAWHGEMEDTLMAHPFAMAAQYGRLPIGALKRFAGEKRRAAASDARSFASLAGFANWRPSPGGLTDCHRNEAPASDGAFGQLLAHELATADALHRLALATGLDLDANGLDDGGEAFASDARAAAASAYWALLARDGAAAAAAAAAALVAPAWARTCDRVRRALVTNGSLDAAFKANGFDRDDALNYLALAATPMLYLDDLAIAVLADDFSKTSSLGCAALKEPVRMHQAFALGFWDSLMDHADDEGK